jgi:hypothetical protein
MLTSILRVGLRLQMQPEAGSPCSTFAPSAWAASTSSGARSSAANSAVREKVYLILALESMDC